MDRQKTLLLCVPFTFSPNWLFPNHTAPTVAPCEGSWIFFHISGQWAYNQIGVLFASYWCFQATLFHKNRQH